MTRFIVDASVAIPWAIPEVWSRQAELLLAPSHERIAPDWIVVEYRNAIWKHVRRGEVTGKEAREISSILSRYLTHVASLPLVGPALDIAVAIDQTVYDSVYVALAERTGLPFVTGDRPLYDAVKRTLTTSIIWIEDLPAALDQ